MLKAALSQFGNHDESRLLFLCNYTNEYFISSGMKDQVMEEISNRVENKLETTDSGSFSVRIQDRTYLNTYTTSKYLNMTLSQYLPEKILFSSVSKYRVWIWVLSLVSFVVILFFSLLAYKIIHRPLHEMVRSFKKVEVGDLDVKIAHKQRMNSGTCMYGSMQWYRIFLC